MASKQWKIADFGLTSPGTTLQPIATKDGRGSPCYRAPELILDPHMSYTKKVDIWSVGCILYEICTDQQAFNSDMAALDYMQTKAKCGMSISIFDERSNRRLTHLLRSMLDSSGSKRPSAEAVHDVFQDMMEICHLTKEYEKLLDECRSLSKHNSDLHRDKEILRQHMIDERNSHECEVKNLTLTLTQLEKDNVAVHQRLMDDRNAHERQVKNLKVMLAQLEKDNVEVPQHMVDEFHLSATSPSRLFSQSTDGIRASCLS